MILAGARVEFVGGDFVRAGCGTCLNCADDDDECNDGGNENNNDEDGDGDGDGYGDNDDGYGG